MAADKAKNMHNLNEDSLEKRVNRAKNRDCRNRGYPCRANRTMLMFCILGLVIAPTPLQPYLPTMTGLLAPGQW
jgi:hypothetical protein